MSICVSPQNFIGIHHFGGCWFHRHFLRLLFGVSAVVMHAYIADTFNYDVIVELFYSNYVSVTTSEVVEVVVAAYTTLVDQLLIRVRNFCHWLCTLFILGLV